MKAILLAAGVGKRTLDIFEGKPKCLAELGNGTSLLSYTIKSLKSFGFEEVIIVTGYHNSFIQKEIEKYPFVKEIYNPFFNVTNSLGSLWFAKSYLNDDCFIMNADVYLSTDSYKAILKNNDTTIFFDSSKIEGADYRFLLKDGKLVKHGKDLKDDETSGEYVGCCLISKKDIEKFKSTLVSMASNNEYDLWWENILYNNVEDFNPHFADLKSTKWGEIDNIKDYEFVKNLYGK